MSASPAISFDPKSPVRKAARLASMWGWSYIITFLAVFGAPDTPSGPLRVLVLNTSILFTLIGIAELYWRHRLLRSGEARWVRILVWNELGGTVALLWNLWLLEEISPKLLTGLLTPESRAQIQQVVGAINDAMLENSFTMAKNMTLYGVGGLLLLSQLYVITRYLALAREIKMQSAIPPVLEE